MTELLKGLRAQFKNEEYRNSYAEGFLNSYIAAQIKTLREQREWTQEELAEKIGTKQTGVSRLENVNYSGWKTETLLKLARAFDLRLKISFEEFGTLPPEIESFNQDELQRRSFKDDAVFNPYLNTTETNGLISDLSKKLPANVQYANGCNDLQLATGNLIHFPIVAETKR